MKECGELLAKIGIGGYYRRTTDAQRVEARGPYPTRDSANPYGQARLPFPMSITAEFHIRRPDNVVAPDPVELQSPQ